MSQKGYFTPTKPGPTHVEIRYVSKPSPQVESSTPKNVQNTYKRTSPVNINTGIVVDFDKKKHPSKEKKAHF